MISHSSGTNSNTIASYDVYLPAALPVRRNEQERRSGGNYNFGYAHIPQPLPSHSDLAGGWPCPKMPFDPKNEFFSSVVPRSPTTVFNERLEIAEPSSGANPVSWKRAPSIRAGSTLAIQIIKIVNAHLLI
jgi:hypothetical protein